MDIEHKLKIVDALASDWSLVDLDELEVDDGSKPLPLHFPSFRSRFDDRGRNRHLER